MYNLIDLMVQVASNKGSGLHLVVGRPPMMRLDTTIELLGIEPLTEKDTKDLIYSVLSQKQIETFETKLELDAAISIQNVGRARLNVFMQKRMISAALRYIPQKTYSFEELRLPKVVNDIVNLQSGLVLITGATGSGKTTTIASMINHINETKKKHIITIEDPIEYVHEHKKSIINQREVGTDTESFASALKSILRQDPDVILVGEMRDLETISATITLAETGHLVFATLHTNDAVSSIDRMIGVFPGNQQAQIRAQIALVLKAVFSQQLLPHSSGKNIRGMVLASEVMVVNDSIRNIIREQKTEQLYSIIQTNKQSGMQTMNQALFDNVVAGLVSPEVAIEYSSRKRELISLLQNVARM
jgi:twitching motility protein PilT